MAEDERNSVILAGDFIRNSTVTPQSLSQILIATGLRSSDKQPVLIPYVEMSLQVERPVLANPPLLESEEEEEAQATTEMVVEEWASQTLPLENAFWLTLDMLRDLSIACERLQQTMPEGALLESERLALAQSYAEEAGQFAERCRKALGALARQSRRIEAERAPKPKKKLAKATATEKGAAGAKGGASKEA